MPRRWLYAFIFIGIILIAGDWYRRQHAVPSGQCTVDPDLTLEQMLVDRALGSANVPKNLAYEPMPAMRMWAATEDTKLFTLPSTQAQSQRIPAGWRGFAICRTRTPDGTWWLVDVRNRGGRLSYIQERSTQWIVDPKS